MTAEIPSIWKEDVLFHMNSHASSLKKDHPYLKSVIASHGSENVERRFSESKNLFN